MSSSNKKIKYEIKKDFQKSQINPFNSQSPIQIPKIPNKYKRSKTPSNNVLPFQDNNKNFLLSPKNNEPSQIKFLKESYEIRIGQLLDMLKNLASKMTPINTTECINEIVFLEKERVISDLNEQNSIIKTEYEENKIEMNRLQKVISVLEIDLNKCEQKLKEKKQELNNLNRNFSTLQAENFDLNLKIKEVIEEYNKYKNENQSTTNQKLYYENIINDLKNQINNNLESFNHKVNEIENNLKIEYETKITEIEEKSNYEMNNKVCELEEKIKKEYIEEINSKHQIEIEQLIQHYQNEINKFQNNSVSKFHDFKQINEKNELELKRLQNDIDILLSENQKLSNNNKTNEQIIILLRSKISGIKSELTTLRKFVKTQLENLSFDNNNFSNIIFSKLKDYVNKYSEERMNNVIEEKVKITKLKYENDLIEQLKLIKQYQKDNKNLLETQNNYIEQNKTLLKQKDEIEKEKIIQHYQSELNQFQNSSVSKFQNYKQINEKNELELKRLQNDIDILLSENQKLSNKNKTNEQIIILLRSKISGIKSEITTLRKFVKNQLENLSIENYNCSNIIFSKLKTYLNKYSEDFINEQIDEKVKETEFKYENDLIEQLKLVKQYQKENKNLLENQNNYIEQNKNLSKQRDELEKENKLLNNTINKLKVELEVVKDALNNKQEDNNSTTISNESIFQLKELINNMRMKYQKEIQKIKNQLNSLYKSAENFNDDQSQKKKEKENKKDILIQLLQKKLEKYKLNQEQFKKVLEKKDNKIKELKGLQEFYSKSYKSIQGGVDSIKIAKLLDNEVQSILKEEKSKTTNNTFNKYGA